MSPTQRDEVRADLASLGSAPGVVAASGPWQTAHVNGETLRAVAHPDPQTGVIVRQR
jgi:hypothetical protein